MKAKHPLFQVNTFQKSRVGGGQGDVQMNKIELVCEVLAGCVQVNMFEQVHEGWRFPK